MSRQLVWHARGNGDRCWRSCWRFKRSIQSLLILKGLRRRPRPRSNAKSKRRSGKASLAALYAEAVRLLKANKYQEALEQWGEVQARDPKYPDRQHVSITAKKKLAALTRPVPRKRQIR